ncbi:MAG: sulfate adenylyltransferase [Helicobacter sp.]|nr:sulfate adenylyltransferase [Helicobacteraceae bacterium]MDY3114149.1 sulfate adenylyltransferase [Helicobacter sp.]
MESQKRNNKELFKEALFVDREAIYALLLCNNGLLSPIEHLMSEKEMQKVDSSGLYNNQNFPLSFVLAPSGKRNEQILLKCKKNTKLQLICENEICGYLIVDSIFKIDKKERVFKIMGGDTSSTKANDIYNRLGDYAVCGKYKLNENIENKFFKYCATPQKIAALREKTNAKHISAMVLDASPITRIHERIFRLILDESDVLVLLLLRHKNEVFLEFEMRKKCLELVIENFFPPNRIVIFALDAIYLFAGSHGIILDSILAKNLGCDRIVIGENYPNLTLYYDNQKTISIFDTLKELEFNIKFISELVYCSKCNTIVSPRTCPHGDHHHIHYNSTFLQEILKAGMIPPTILVRKEISAKILSHLFPKRFTPLLKQFSAMFSSSGMLEEQNEEDFYLKLAELYKTSLN